MRTKLSSLLERVPQPTADTVGAPFRRRDIAVVALLIELARIDRRTSREEIATIDRIVRERFAYDADTAADLVAAAQAELDASLVDWIFANAVRVGFAADERAEIVALLWEIVYADGRFAHLEQALLGRLSEELGVGVDDAAAARATAYARASGRAAREAEDAE